MGYFDLNIPTTTTTTKSTQSNSKTRTKQAMKSMELGYTAVAYNHTITGVMSDHDRCSIPLLSLSSLLCLSPPLSASVRFRRDLLNLPPASVFRQYTRLTVCAETLPQCQVLNGGNPVLKTYDLVAVKPMSQVAFDHACDKAEVDIISIDFSEKVPFRLKLPMVKAAMQRGICFEITYSDLIVDAHMRRQMISNAKLLVDWTRGKNLILSSAAPSVNEMRGPCDVANLSSLLGLSMERAKAAISKNCRDLVAKALRRKHFYKDTIRVEFLTSKEQSNSKESSSLDWLNWDPISSGEGVLQLDDIAKFFSASGKASNTIKSIDSTSSIDGTLPNGDKLIEPTTESIEVPVTDRNTLSNTWSNDESFGCKSSEEHIPIKNGPNNLNHPDASVLIAETGGDVLQSQECNASCDRKLLMENVKCLTSAVNVLSEKVDASASDIDNAPIFPGSDVSGAHNLAMIEVTVEHPEDRTVAENISIRELNCNSGGEITTVVDQAPDPVTSDDMEVEFSNSDDHHLIPVKEQVEGAHLVPANDMQFEVNSSIDNHDSLVAKLEEQEHPATANGMQVDILCSASKHVTSLVELDGQEREDADSQSTPLLSDGYETISEELMDQQKLEELSIKMSHPMVVAPPSEKLSSKRRKRYQLPLFPLSRSLQSLRFKRKHRKIKRKVKMVL